MKPQIIKTEAGEEAEDCGTARLMDAYLVNEAAGRVAAIPHWFVKLVIEHGSPVAAARAYRGWTEAELAQATGLNGDLIARFERAEAEPDDGERQRLAEQTGTEPGWLR